MAKRKARDEKPAAALTPHQQHSESVEVHRRQIKGAPYNPRKIVESARKKLLENVERIGLLGGLVWNKRSGNLVAGHQRLSVLDTLHRTQDYLVRVERVDLDDATERQQNLFMNNPSAQGDWDMGALGDMLKEPSFGIELAGFNLTDVYKVFGFSPSITEPEHLVKLAEEMRKIKEARMRKDKASRPGNNNEIGYYRVLVFESVAEADAWAVANDLETEMFIQGRGLRVVRGTQEKVAG